VRARAELVESILFAANSAELRLPERNMLDRKVALLKANPNVHLKIDGKVDEKEKGADKGKAPLGMQRANAALKYLVSKGIDAGRLDVAATDDTNPKCTTHEEWCWSQNRRVDFTITAGDTITPVP